MSESEATRSVTGSSRGGKVTAEAPPGQEGVGRR